MSLCLVLILTTKLLHVEYHRGQCLAHFFFLLYINDMPKCSNILEFNLFADDTNLFLNSPNILNLETNLNVELGKGSQWLYANKLSLNI